jgi:hypothetical protein
MDTITDDSEDENVRRDVVRKFFPYSDRHQDRLQEQGIIPKPALILPNGAKLWSLRELKACAAAYMAAAAAPKSVKLSDAVIARMAAGRAQKGKRGRFTKTKTKTKQRKTGTHKATKPARKAAVRPTKKRAAAGAELVVTT